MKRRLFHLSVPIFALLLILTTMGGLKAQGQTLATGDGTLRRIHVPILMYHYVSQLPANADNIRVGLTVSPDQFQAHMNYLKAQGYDTISLYQLDDALMNGTALPPKPIILTFDDGYIDHYVTVFPILKQLGFTGTFFIITGMPDSNAPAYMSWTQITEMADAGMSMESHTKTHQDLRNRDYNFLVYELLGSMQSLQAYTGHEPHMFAYPSGEYDDETLSVLRQLPVWRALTTEHGSLETTDNRLEVPRLRVSGGMDVNGLEALLRSG